MDNELRLQLGANAQQQARLQALQSGFAELCNAIAPTVQQTRVWNRVALHHMVYRPMRERFPAMGSQMVCNAVYAVSRTARLIFQTSGSPFHHSRLADRPLPLFRFTDRCPVFFDRHTLSVKGRQMSMFTLDGRMKFELMLTPQQVAAFEGRRILEMMLVRVGERFELRIQFDPQQAPDERAPAELASASARDPSRATHTANPPESAVLPPWPAAKALERPTAFSAPPAPPVPLDHFLELEEAAP
jgi:hypothetical protein